MERVRAAIECGIPGCLIRDVAGVSRVELSAVTAGSGATMETGKEALRPLPTQSAQSNKAIDDIKAAAHRFTINLAAQAATAGVSGRRHSAPGSFPGVKLYDQPNIPLDLSCGCKAPVPLLEWAATTTD